MLWDCLLLFSAFWMNGLSTEFIDSCARGLGSKRLRLSLPWEDSSVEHVISDKKESIIRPPTWVEFPLQLFDHADAVSRPARLDRYNAKVHLSEVSWVASEDRKLNDALQCWRVIVLDSTSNTELGNFYSCNA